VSGRVAIPLQDMDIVGSFDTDFNQARLNASASMGFSKGDISGNIGTDLKNVYGGVDINYRPIDPLSLNYSLNADPSGVYHDIGASYDVNDNVNLYGNVSLTPQELPAYRVGLRANFEHGGTHVDPSSNKLVYTDGGDVIDPGDGWQYLKEGNNYLTRQKGNTNWITAKGDAKKAIQTRIFSEPVGNPLPQEQQISIENIDTPENFIQPNINRDTIAIQQKLFDAGYDLGTTGPLQNGVDGDLGPKTKAAIDAYNKGINAQDFKSQDLKMQNEIINQEYKEKPQTANYVTNIQKYLIGKGYEINESGVMDTKTKNALKDYETSGKFATLPIFPSNPEKREEICDNKGDGYGCAKQATLKLGKLFTPTSMPNSLQNLWANDAWFNKDAVIKNGGTLLYETDIRGSKMPQLPKEVYGLLQVGDYVHLDRRDTPFVSADYASRTTDAAGNKWENEKVEHVGIIIGKDFDGTPLVWHSSDTGKAYIKRVDEPITLDDHKFLGAYQIASIARAGAMKDKYQNEVAQNPYFMLADKTNTLKPLTDDLNSHQQGAINAINDNMNDFVKAGYNQDDVNKVGQVLLGVMGQESSGGQSTDATLGFLPSKVSAKTAAATVTKEWLGIEKGFPLIGPYVGKKFKGDEASEGLYQIKVDYNFSDENLRNKLKAVGLNVEDVMDNEENQTKAASIIMLDNYDKLKKDPNYNKETDTWSITGDDGKVWSYPAEYILAGAWSAGSGWQKREKYRKMLTSTEGRDYSINALKKASSLATTTKDKNYTLNAMNVVKDRNRTILNEINKNNLVKEMTRAGYDPNKITQQDMTQYTIDKLKRTMPLQIDTPPVESTDTNIFMDPNIIIPSDLYSDFVYGAYDLPEVTVTAKRKRTKNR
jgi:hypothetical protein